MNHKKLEVDVLGEKNMHAKVTNEMKGLRKEILKKIHKIDNDSQKELCKRFNDLGLLLNLPGIEVPYGSALNNPT